MNFIKWMTVIVAYFWVSGASAEHVLSNGMNIMIPEGLVIISIFIFWLVLFLLPSYEFNDYDSSLN